MTHNSLQNYYSTMFSMVQHHKYSVTELENMLPFERDIYVDMLLSYLRELEEHKQKQNR